ncbi:hypothetical protein DESUT3_37300 [Desulfuromonas versatilis]|uniref:Uncharacterized protein n=1 Tax=Desulfuromonas versatilis TaxID=2802975 RepID=A0ABM8HZY2_9BACT|nr:hypothetical protein [Desulfuromonas versatilis]BCR06661.1 hypothetical protein DESUT3_37300 [Desulfuromonas versatilis]
MKTLLNGILTILIFASGSAMAAGDGSANESSLLVMLFLGFLALLVVMQLLPGLALFASMIKGLFTRIPRTPLASDEKPRGSA